MYGVVFQNYDIMVICNFGITENQKTHLFRPAWYPEWKKTTTKNIDRIGRQSDLLKITFDPNLVNRFLTCDRILAPDSKHGSLHHMANYYEQPAFDYMHIMRTMDLMADHYDEYIFHLFEKKQ